jgi:hypothetical protein
MLAVVAFSILLTWMLCALVLAGIGTLLLRRLRVEYALFDAFWAGLCVAVASLEVYHFFRSVDVLIVGILSTVGFYGIILNRNLLVVGHWQDRWFKFRPAVCCTLVLAVIAARCAGPAVHYDTGFYGAMAVRWFVTYPLVPGLTNLLGQLGLNSNVFLCVAVLDHGPWHNLGFHLFVGLLLSAIVISITESFSGVFLNQKQSPLNYFVLLFAVPGIVWVLTGEIVGTNTDLPTTVVLIAAMIALFDGLQEGVKPDGSQGLIESRLLVAMLLFILALTFKISSLAFAGLGWGVAFLELFSLKSPSLRKRQLIIPAVLLSAALAIPWLIRGVILSGYPLFPSSAFAVTVDWRVPRVAADMLAQFNRSWARIPHAGFEETSGIRWVGRWFAGAIGNRVDFIAPLFISLVGFIFLLRRGVFKDLFWLKLLLPSLGGLAFWFSLAPAFRFGEAAIWTTAACLGAAALQQLLPATSLRGRQVVLLGLLVLGGWCSYPRTIWRVYFRPLLAVQGFLPLPQARTMPYDLNSGLIIRVPIETNQCWDATIPCSPYFADSLQLRNGQNLRWGFRVERPDSSLPSDRFTPLHRRYVTSKPVEERCRSCHLQID